MDHSEILKNRSRIEKENCEEVLCPECDELYVFGMQDKHHTFSLGLSTVLQCVAIAEKNGVVPPLPAQWWTQVFLHSKKIENVCHKILERE